MAGRADVSELREAEERLRASIAESAEADDIREGIEDDLKTIRVLVHVLDKSAMNMRDVQWIFAHLLSHVWEMTEEVQDDEEADWVHANLRQYFVVVEDKIHDRAKQVEDPDLLYLFDKFFSEEDDEQGEGQPSGEEEGRSEEEGPEENEEEPPAEEDVGE